MLSSSQSSISVLSLASLMGMPRPKLRLRRKMKWREVKAFQDAVEKKKKAHAAEDKNKAQAAADKAYIRLAFIREGVATMLEEWLVEKWFLFSNKWVDLKKKGNEKLFIEYEERTRKFANEYLSQKQETMWLAYMQVKESLSEH